MPLLLFFLDNFLIFICYCLSSVIHYHLHPVVRFYHLHVAYEHPDVILTVSVRLFIVVLIIFILLMKA